MKFINNTTKKKLVSALRIHVFALLALVFLSFYYLAPSYVNCTTQIYGFGDNTAGLIWRNQVSPEKPLGGFQEFTNFPSGESIYSPTRFSNLFQFTSHWVLAKIQGPICAYNTYVIAGLLMTSFIAYAFFYSLVHRRGISLVGSLLITYTPYAQLKVGGHPSYAYIGLVLGIVWLLTSFVNKRKPSTIVAAALLTSLCFYIDPYFVLLAGFAWIPLVGLLIKELIFIKLFNPQKKKDSIRARHSSIMLLSSFFIVVLLISPLIFIRFHYADVINSEVGSARGIGQEIAAAQICSNLPHEYLLPSEHNYFITKVGLSSGYAELTRKLGHTCNPSEDNVGLSIALWITLFFIIFSCIFTYLRKVKTGVMFSSKDKYILAYCSVLLLTSLLFALPPEIAGFKTPTYYVLELFSMWRIPARLFLIVNMSAVTMFIIAFSRFVFDAPRLRNNTIARIIISIVLLGTVMFEYQTVRPFGLSKASFDYSTGFANAYHWLREQEDIKSLAEYPLDRVGESETISLALTAQPIHGKKLLNSSLSNSVTEDVRRAIKDLKNPQTLPVLKALGIDAIIIRGVSVSDVETISGLNVLYQEYFNGAQYGGSYIIAKIDDSVKPNSIFLSPENGFVFNGIIQKSPIQSELEALNNATLSIAELSSYHKSIPKNQEGLEYEFCFSVKLASGELTPKTVSKIHMKDIVSGKEVSSFTIDSINYKHVSITAPVGTKMAVSNEAGFNMRFDELGCE